MSEIDLIAGVFFAFLLAVVGSLALAVTRNNRPTLRLQLALLLASFAIRFLMSVLLYGFGLSTTVIGDEDGTGWYAGVGLKEAWEEQGIGPLELPAALLGAFQGNHRGYGYLLAVYFSVTRVPSRLSAAALNCLCGALTAVFAYRIARVHFSHWVAVRVGWWTCFFPSMIIWSAQTVKEPVVILLEVVAIYGCLRLRANGFSLGHVALAAFPVVALATLRFYAAYVTGSVILLTLILPQLGRRRMAVGPALGVGVIAVPLLFYSGALLKHASEFEKWDVRRAEQFRRGMTVGTGSGVESTYDMQTTRGLGLAMLVGAVHLLLAPLPWQLGGGSIRMVLTAPEMVAWWCLFFAGVLPGLRYAIRYRFGDLLPLLLFILGLGLIYSMTFGNVGTVYRQRAQLMPYLLTFAASGLERRKSSLS